MRVLDEAKFLYFVGFTIRCPEFNKTGLFQITQWKLFCTRWVVCKTRERIVWRLIRNKMNCQIGSGSGMIVGTLGSQILLLFLSRSPRCLPFLAQFTLQHVRKVNTIQVYASWMTSYNFLTLRVTCPFEICRTVIEPIWRLLCTSWSARQRSNNNFTALFVGTIRSLFSYSQHNETPLSKISRKHSSPPSLGEVNVLTTHTRARLRKRGGTPLSLLGGRGGTRESPKLLNIVG